MTASSTDSTGVASEEGGPQTTLRMQVLQIIDYALQVMGDDGGGDDIGGVRRENRQRPGKGGRERRGK